MRPITGDQGFIRKLNTSIILDCLRLHAPLSRAEISSKTGLNRSTVSSIVNTLLREGLVCETKLQSSKLGRPGMLLELNPDGGCAIGIEIGVDFISVILTDFVAQVLWQRRVSSDPELAQISIIERAEGLVAKALAFAEERALRPLGIGIGVPGLVDLRKGKLIFAPNLQWHDVPLRLMWNQRFSLPIFVENEANAAALGEYYFGVAKGVENFLYLSAGVGLGGGIMVDGKLFRGSQGYAGEIGHMTLYPDGDLCACGKRGCWETVVGPRALMRRVRQAIVDGAESSIQTMTRGELNKITVEIIAKAAGRGDPVALTALEEVAYHLGLGIANLVNAFNPALIVLGGALNVTSKFLLPIIEKTVRDNVLMPSLEGMNISPSAHGADACVMGAVALVLDEILRMPM